MIDFGVINNIDLNCDYIHWEISAPEPRQELVEIPFRDGVIDLYRLAGFSSRIFYGPRTITVGLELRGLRSEWPLYYSKALNALHGQHVTVKRTEDPDWYWDGYATVGDLEDHKSTAGITVTVRADPYKRKDPVLLKTFGVVLGYSYTDITLQDRSYLSFDVPDFEQYLSVEIDNNGARYYIPAEGATDLILAEKGTHRLVFRAYDSATVNIYATEVSL